MVTARSWSGMRPLGRTTGMGIPEKWGPLDYHPPPVAPPGRARDPQHDRLRLRRTHHALGHAVVRSAVGEPPLPRDRRAHAGRAARAGTPAARTHRVEDFARQGRTGPAP